MAFRFIPLALSLMLALGGGVAMAQEAAPAEPTPEQILAGKRIWTDAACFNCHGTNGQGGSSKDFPHGPSLRQSALDRATIYEVTACGLPGTLMPAWAKGAYTERGCFGDEPGEVPEGTRVIGAYDEAQMQSLMDYIYATFRKGKD
ncbi:MAG: cytochrome c [Hyphomicrobiales bacterium]|nr:MAG: cytochrome c [Hyphomicrobiales bacterium]